jgi:23S rRNA (cytosine1962-C5)-methyltransferase
LATAFALKSHPLVHVTHVDLAKRAIERAKHNVALNNIDMNSRVRWIVDDALSFMAREGRKGNKYDLIVIDPPSFSRVSKQNSWTLDEKVAEIISLVMGVLNRIPGAKIFFTNHSSASTSEIARNVALDTFGDRAVDVEIASLSLAELDSPRRLPAGSLIVLSLM